MKAHVAVAIVSLMSACIRGPDIGIVEQQVSTMLRTTTFPWG